MIFWIFTEFTSMSGDFGILDILLIFGNLTEFTSMSGDFGNLGRNIEIWYFSIWWSFSCFLLVLSEGAIWAYFSESDTDFPFCERELRAEKVSFGPYFRF